jgi:SAM-dependent methyltransferase
LFYLRSYLHEFSPETQRRRRIDLEFDETYRVDTRIDFDPGWLAEIDSPNWVHGRGYSPAPHHSLRKTLERIDIDFEQFTFIDFGSGKGRSLLVAAEYPFDQIIGVEYSHRLSEVAEKNFRTY